MSREVVVTSTGGPFAQAITAGPHQIISDEPAEEGGADAGPNPYDLLLAALGACTSMTLKMYARRKQWPLEKVEVRLGHRHGYAEDCEQCENEKSRLSQIERRITLTGPLSDEQKQRLLAVAEKCPVHKTLSGKLQIRTRLADEAEAAATE